MIDSPLTLPRRIISGRRRHRLHAAFVRIGVPIANVVAPAHFDRAHQIFRAARGSSIEINTAWNEIKRWRCPVCGGKKNDRRSDSCSILCRGRRAARHGGWM